MTNTTNDGRSRLTKTINAEEPQMTTDYEKRRVKNDEKHELWKLKDSDNGSQMPKNTNVEKL